MSRSGAKRNAVKAAMSVATDITEGRLDPDDLAAAVAGECRQLFARVEGPDDPLWELQVDVARQVLAVGGWISADELSEWVAVYRRAENAAVESVGGDVPAEPVSSVLGVYGAPGIAIPGVGVTDDVSVVPEVGDIQSPTSDVPPGDQVGTRTDPMVESERAAGREVQRGPVT